MATTDKSLVVLGGTSDIARATALAFASRGWTIRLAGRNPAEFQREADDIAARGGLPVTIHKFDVLDTASFPEFVEALPNLPDVVISAIGLLGDQARAEADLDQATTIMRTNYEGPALILGLFAERFLKRGSGSIIGVSSVAGDRGRGSNYVYGSAKAGLTAFLSGLRNRTASRGIHVMTVKPGFVRTKMTENMQLPRLLLAEPIDVGEAIFRGLNKKKNVVYASSIWFYVMFVIRMIPEFLFKKLKL
jgi:decaprenylphospho-beta-D-erythro-pentofuranosid-2-ulose 2-reductase